MINLIFNALSEIEIASEKANEINKIIRAIDGGDFAPEISFISSNIETAIIKIIDKYLEELTGDETLASYYLYDCGKKGKIILPNGEEYPLTSIQELRAYVEKAE